ncbi:Rieske (2Fe-2S) protein [Pseudonocardia thermophila]|uniref:Rieske (2Fe-2S) protein n=1 Tax=Pseudonocardia thermophila TaxID=1848 RepID=UPI00248D7364|nr:Rieske 2Fe-2S domain-containing protein [Pseudonocardia thermophila]
MSVVVCAEAELSPGAGRLARLRGKEVLVVRGADGVVRAVANRCPHQGARLSDGPISGEFLYDDEVGVTLSRIGQVVRCPWHNYAFDLETGCSLLEPDRFRIATYPVAIVDGNVVLDP